VAHRERETSGAGASALTRPGSAVARTLAPPTRAGASPPAGTTSIATTESLSRRLMPRTP
jgi:hypothetical protein